MGKSRLLGEFGLWLQSQAGGATQLSAQASERRRGQPYGLMRDIFMNRLGLRVHDGSEAARWAWLHAAESVLGQRSNAAVLGHLLGLNFGDVPEVRALLDDARALRDRAFFHAFQWLAHTVASAKPLVVALDDLHWADEGSLAFFEQLQRSHSELPLLLIVLARPLLLERHPAWGSHGDSRRINLAPLDERASQALSRALLQHLPEVPAQLAQLVAQGAEGNPFFMEELVNMLIDQGAIEVQGTTWTLHPSRLSALQLPTTLNGVLQARLDVLPHDRRRALQLASVAGPVFWDQALQVLDVMAVAALPELTHRELIRPHEESRLVGMLEYEFRHHTVHRVAYESLLKGVKRATHAVLARWLSEQPAAASLQDQIAEHHERGGERGLARDAWQRAADAARLRFANAEALAHAERALALTEEQDLPQRLALTLLQLRVFETLADRARLSQALAALQSLADLSGDAGWRSEAAAWRGRFEYHGGNALAALEHAQQAATLAPAADLERAARARSQEFFALARLGRHVQAQQSFEAALQLARQAGHATLEASIVNEQGNRELGRGDVLAATAHWQQALAIHRQQGHLANMGGTLCNLAFAAMSVGDFDAAKTQFEEAHALCERVGQQQNAGIIGINLGIVLLHLQQPEQALQHACRALDLLRRSGDRWAEAAALRVAGQSEQALGSPDAARARFLASRDLFDELNLGHLALEAIAALAEEALARGDVAAAKAHAEDIIARQLRGVGIEGTDEPMRIPLAVWRVLQAAGDVRAHEALAAARRELLARADRLLDVAQRQRYLQAVAPHREIMAATGPG